MPRLSLPFESWPEIDRQLWASALIRSGLFDEEGLCASWSETTKRQTLHRYGRWLGFVAAAEPAALALAPEARITRARVDAYLAQLRATCGVHAQATYLFGLLTFARLAAPGADLTWLKAIKRPLERAGRPRRTPALDPNAIVDLGEALMAEGLAARRPYDRRSLYRDGLILLLATLIPLRRRNLAGLEIGRHLIDVGEAWRIDIPGSETKTGRPLTFHTPERLTRALDTYIDEIRPLFPGAAATRRLWVSNKGRPLCAEQLREIVARRTAAGLGCRLTPHQLRDVAATRIAELDPKRAMLARDLLGHADYRTTERHYIAAQGLVAGRRLAETLARDRADPEVRRHLSPRRR